MFRISGPELIAVIQNEKNKKQMIYLFGDEHNDTIGKCKKCKLETNCMSITQFLKQLQKQDADIFIESPWILQDYKKFYSNEKKQKYDDVLLDIKKTFHKELYSHKQTKSVSRFHYTDIRTEPHISILGYVSYIFHFKSVRELSYVVSVIKDFCSINMFVDYVNACVLSNDYVKSITKLFVDDKEKANKYIVSKALTNFSTSKYNIHKIRKQLLKLTPKERKSIIRYHNDKLQKLMSMSFSKQYTENRNQFLNNPSLYTPFAARINNVIHHYLAHLMDIYHLSRMIHYLSKSSNLIVSYTGSHHTHNYIEYFIHYHSKYMSLIHIDDKSEQSDDLTNKRCVVIPETYLTGRISGL